MSYFDDAVLFTLGAEGVFSNDPNDRGHKTKYGVTESELKAYQTATGKLVGVPIEQLSQLAAIEIFRVNYWKFDGIQSRMIALKLFDMSVNFGVFAAAVMAQTALGFLGVPVTIDGQWGPATESAINAQDRLRYHHALVYHAAQRYVKIVTNDPSQLTFIEGWLLRASRRAKD